MKERADRLLVARHLADGYDKARALIMAGLVYSGGEKIDKAGRMLDTEAELSVRETRAFASRAGAKLRQALDAFGIDPSGKVAADIGASTGGFTDCLLQRGARRVYAVDVDTKQLDWRLRRDARVLLVEKNARFLEPRDFPETPDLVTLDVSFISILKILPVVKAVCGGGTIVALIKPQFEAERFEVGPKGVIRDSAVHARVLKRVLSGAEEAGFVCSGLVRCLTPGRTGNTEFLAHFKKEKSAGARKGMDALIEEVIGHE